MKKIYVGNLPFSSTEDEIRQMFAEHGTVTSVSCGSIARSRAGTAPSAVSDPSTVSNALLNIVHRSLKGRS